MHTSHAVVTAQCESRSIAVGRFVHRTTPAAPPRDTIRHAAARSTGSVTCLTHTINHNPEPDDYPIVFDTASTTAEAAEAAAPATASLMTFWTADVDAVKRVGKEQADRLCRIRGGEVDVEPAVAGGTFAETFCAYEARGRRAAQVVAARQETLLHRCEVCGAFSEAAPGDESHTQGEVLMGGSWSTAGKASRGFEAGRPRQRTASASESPILNGVVAFEALAVPLVAAVAGRRHARAATLPADLRIGKARKLAFGHQDRSDEGSHRMPASGPPPGRSPAGTACRTRILRSMRSSCCRPRAAAGPPPHLPSACSPPWRPV
eukprot:46915-Prymnesium_polylepis.1